MLDDNDLKKIGELTKSILKESNEEMAAIINQSFQEQQDWIKSELDKKPSRYEIFGYVDKKTEPLEMDMDKVKYIHRDEWKSLPNQRKISESLAADGLKK
jgi:hypothetical protein